MYLLKFCKYAEILIGIALNMYNNLGRIDSPTILRLPVHKNDIYLHLFSSSSISFTSILYFSVHKICFVRFSMFS